MDFSSLPNYLTFRAPKHTARVDNTNLGFTPRALRIFRDLVLVMTIVMLLHWLRWTATALEHPPAVPIIQPPLDFNLVMERSSKVRMFASREEVIALLGSPPPINGDWAVDLRNWFASAEHSNRHLGIPSERYWYLWTDPRDGNRGLAILFADGKVYHIGKKGF